MIIGIPKEILKGENRVSATPTTVKKMIENGHKVLVEKEAGLNAFYLDGEYAKAGATIIDNVENLYNQAEIILKVKEPKYNSNVGKHEIDMMRKGAIFASFLHPANHLNHEMVRMLVDKGITSFTLDGVPRIPKAKKMDALSSMSVCAGYKGIIRAADNLAKIMHTIDSPVGIIKPAKVLVVGCGVAGLSAIRTAKGLGAEVYASDVRKEALENAKNLGAKIIKSIVPEELIVSKESKYVDTLSQEYLKMKREEIKDYVKNADIIFLSALVFGKEAQFLITKEMVETMQPGSYIVDISIDQGGNCELTKAGQVIEANGVKIDGTTNIPGMIQTSSTYMFAENTYNFLNHIVKDNKLNLDMSDEIISSTLVSHKGKLYHAGTIEAMKSKTK